VTAGLVVLAALLAAALALPGRPRARERCALGAAALTPVLLVVHVRDTSALQSLWQHPPVLAVLVLAGLVAVGALAALFVRRPDALPVLAVAALPFRIPLAVGGGTANLLVPLYLVIGSGVLALAWGRRRREPGAAVTEPGPLERVLAVVLLLYALQSTYSDDTGRAVENVVFFYAPFALLFVLLTRQVAWTRRLCATCLGVLVGLALVFAGIGFVEYATRHLLLNPKVISSNQFEEYFRVNSLFFDPNIYGRFLALVMLGVSTVLLWTRRSRLVGGAAVVLAILWAGLVVTFSQSSFTALIVGLAVLAGLRWGPRLAAGVAGAVGVAGLAVVLLAPGVIRLDTGSSGKVDSATSGRYDLIAGGARLARDRPLGGYGSGAFARVYRRQESASVQRATSASHTIPITVAAEQGVVGLLAYLALLGIALARLGRGAREDPARAFLLAAFVALLVHTLLYAAFLEDPLTWALLGAGGALAAVPRSRRRAAS
jgi:O-antigen ligase